MSRKLLAIALAIASAALLGACGGDSDDPTTPPAPIPEEANGDDDAGDLSPDEAAALAAVREYLTGMAEKDWTAVCGAVSEKLRGGLENTTNLTCEESVELIYDSDQFQNFGETFAEVEPESVVVTGNRAVVDLGVGGEEGFPLVRQDGEWKFHEE